MQDIKANVRGYILDNFVMGSGGATFKDADSFMANHIIDSTGFLELVSYLEETYGFAVEDDEMVPENLDSVDNIDAYVRRKTAAA
jgi:acyl carrier protein